MYPAMGRRSPLQSGRRRKRAHYFGLDERLRVVVTGMEGVSFGLWRSIRERKTKDSGLVVAAVVTVQQEAPQAGTQADRPAWPGGAPPGAVWCCQHGRETCGCSDL